MGSIRGVATSVDRWLLHRPTLRSVVRSSLQAANTPIAQARFRRAVAQAPRPLRLEIGGHTPRNGWLVTNVNAVARLYLDATKRWPIEKNSVEYVFSDNVIEHLTLQQGRSMLREARRCMRPGGVIRTVTPDLRAHVDMYLSKVDVQSNEIAGHYREIGLDVEYPIDLVRVPVAAFGHHTGYIYDFDTLAAELERAGFKNIVRCELGESEHEALRGLDIRSYEGEAQLAVEATA